MLKKWWLKRQRKQQERLYKKWWKMYLRALARTTDPRLINMSA